MYNGNSNKHVLHVSSDQAPAPIASVMKSFQIRRFAGAISPEAGNGEYHSVTFKSYYICAKFGQPFVLTTRHS